MIGARAWGLHTTASVLLISSESRRSSLDDAVIKFGFRGTRGRKGGFGGVLSVTGI